MIENMNGVRKVDVFNDIVSRLEDSKRARVSDDVVSGMKNYYGNKQDYRSRVEKLSENLKGVKPIDTEINNVVYLSDFMERGIAIRSTLPAFKQIWVEYRLIFNENVVKEEKTKVVNLDDLAIPRVSLSKPVLQEKRLDVLEESKVDALDDNYKKLYNRVLNLNKYVEDFNKKKLELDRQIANLEERKRNLSSELTELEIAKKEFERYKKDEQKKIDNMKNEVNSKVVSLQNLIDNLDDILGKVN